MEQNFEVVYDFANLYAAYRATRKGKRWKDAVAKVELNTLEAITVLQAELRDGLYKPGNYHEFYVFEPKRRLIQTNSVKDKIVQHAFCDNILYPVLSRPLSWITTGAKSEREPISASTASVTSCGSITGSTGAPTAGS